MRFLLILSFLTIIVNAVEYKMVFNHNIYLDKKSEASLKLYEEKTQSFAQNPAKIVIEYIANNKKEQYSFSENLNHSNKYYLSTNSESFPIFYFKNITFNNKKKRIVNLVDSVNVFDIDGNGNNEVFVYGTSHYGGSGSFGKVVIFEKDGDKIIQKAPIIEANDNYEIKYYREKNIIIVAQYIWRGGIEAHYGDSHKYKFYIYEIDNSFRKIPILLSQKKIHDEDKNIIEQNLENILIKYSLYQNSKVSNEEENRVISFVKNYWNKVSDRDFNFIENSLSSKPFYYTKNFSKNDILRDKRRTLKKVKQISFELDDFLVYKRNGKFIVEYTKSFDIDNGADYGVVKSILELEDLNSGFLISVEKDIAVLSLRKDVD